MRVECQELRVEGRRIAIALRAYNSQLSTLNPAPRRASMTLIELLVVIIILTTVVAAAIPLLSPSNDDRRDREATRGLNTYITGAQARAISTNRPFGIAIKRLSQDTKRAEDRGVCLEVFCVEQQPPYAGFDVNSRACVAIHPTPPANVPDAVLVRLLMRGTTTAGLPVGWTSDALPSGMIRPRDVIEINGTRFELRSEQLPNIAIDQNGYFQSLNNSRPPQILARPVNDSGQQINTKYDDNGSEIGTVTSANRPYWTGPAPYKVWRQPTAAADEPYQLPEGTAIDLRASGVGRDNYFYVPGLHDASDDGILIMFAPEGRVSRVSFSQAPDNPTPFDGPIVDNVYLLIGNRANVPAPDYVKDGTLDPSTFSASPPKTDEELQKMRATVNWLNGNSRWIAIGPQTGRIATIENAVVDLAPIANSGASYEQMRTDQILSAREFTREMGQLGGR